jgi:hypothetical protein
MLRMWGGAIVGLAATSFFMSMEDPSGSRSAFCLGMSIYHACAASIILHLFFSAEETPLPGAPLTAWLGGAMDAAMQRKACAMAAVVIHGYLGLGLYKKAKEPTDEVLVVWEDDEDDEDDEEQ